MSFTFFCPGHTPVDKNLAPLDTPSTGPPSPHPHAEAPSVPPPAFRHGTRIRDLPGEWWKVSQPPSVLPPLSDSYSNDAEAGFVEVQFAGTTSVADPCIYKQAMQGPDALLRMSFCL